MILAEIQGVKDIFDIERQEMHGDTGCRFDSCKLARPLGER